MEAQRTKVNNEDKKKLETKNKNKNLVLTDHEKCKKVAAEMDVEVLRLSDQIYSNSRCLS